MNSPLALEAGGHKEDMETIRKRYIEVRDIHEEIVEDFKKESRKCKFCKKNHKEHAYYQYICKHPDTRTNVCVFGQCPIVMGFAK